jgi:ribonuclease D
MTSELIATDAALYDLCRALDGSEWIALDTEFLRERTYYARLCLVQIGAPGIVACVDPLALEQLEPLHALLENPHLRKVLHSARQDIEVFNDLRGIVPAPLFDTQIAAAYLGYDDQVGYAALVTAITGVILDKTHTRTDWSKRPLSSAQHQYAEDDVRYLMPVYETLHERLEAAGRLAWVMDDCARLSEPALYANDPAEAWRRLRGGAELAAPNQQMLRALATFRELTAKTHNLPRGWVLRDDVLFELARRAPQTHAELVSIRGLEDSARQRYGEGILASIEQGRRAEPFLVWERHAPPTPEQNTLGKRLMEIVRSVAQENDLAPAVLATRRDIEKLVRGAEPASVLRGWRGELLGEKLGALLPF